MDNGLSGSRKLVAAVLGHVFFWGLVIGLGFWLGFPLGGISVAALLILNLLVLAAVYHVRDRGQFAGYSTTTKQQLTAKEAYRLVRYMLPFDERYGYRVDRVIDEGVDPAKSPSDDKEDAVRLYKFEFEPMNVSGRAVLYVDLEQELSVDLDDDDSLPKAADQIQNIRMVKSWTVDSYADMIMDVKESLGRSVSPTITRITETDEGREIEEYPALPSRQNQSSADTETSESGS